MNISPQRFHAALVSSLHADLRDPKSFALWKTVDTPRDISDLSFDPAVYRTSYDASKAYLAYSLLRKARDLGGYSPEDRRNSALLKFKQSEENCRRVNSYLLDRSSPARMPGLDSLIYRVSRKLDSIFGSDIARDDFCELALGGAYHGTGSTTSIPFNEASTSAKFSRKFSVTRDAAPFFLEVSAALDLHMLRVGDTYARTSIVPSELAITIGDKLTTVPKSAKTDRTICIGPTANVFLQLGVKRWMQRCLLKAGIDLTSQRTNRDLARLGSATGIVATIDLESASDNISSELVRQLLSPRLFVLLDTIRSKFYTDSDGFAKPYAKFSGMGNGFTFPLQTAIYYAVCLCALEDHELSCNWLVSVYGDDIIVPTSCYDTVCSYLSAFGFVVNVSKSYASGPFRESCGGHYWLGDDITPVYFKGAMSTTVQPWDISILSNSLFRWARRYGGWHVLRQTLRCLERFYKEACAPFKCVPRAPFWAPSSAGFPILSDSLLVGADNNGRCKFRGFRFVPLYRQADDGITYRLWLRSMELSTTSRSALPGISVLLGTQPFDGRETIKGAGRFQLGNLSTWYVDDVTEGAKYL